MIVATLASPEPEFCEILFEIWARYLGEIWLATVKHFISRFLLLECSVAHAMFVEIIFTYFADFTRVTIA